MSLAVRLSSEEPQVLALLLSLLTTPCPDLDRHLNAESNATYSAKETFGIFSLLPHLLDPDSVADHSNVVRKTLRAVQLFTSGRFLHPAVRMWSYKLIRHGYEQYKLYNTPSYILTAQQYSK